MIKIYHNLQCELHSNLNLTEGATVHLIKHKTHLAPCRRLSRAADTVGGQIHTSHTEAGFPTHSLTHYHIQAAKILTQLQREPKSHWETSSLGSADSSWPHKDDEYCMNQEAVWDPDVTSCWWSAQSWLHLTVCCNGKHEDRGLHQQ